MPARKAAYGDWGKYLTLQRSRVFRSAREFCSRKDLGVSYPQYSRYESGEQLPSLEGLLRIQSALELSLPEVLKTWLDAQVTSNDDRRKISEACIHGDRATPSKGVNDAVPLDQVIVFNRSHLQVFARSPSYRDLFTYVNAFGQESPVKPAEAAASLELDIDQATSMLQELAGMGVLEEREDHAFYASKRLFYFPDDAEFFELRRRNLQHNLDAVLKDISLEDLSAKSAYRQVVTRELSEEQVRELVSHLEATAHRMLMQPERQASRVYSLCMVFGARFARVVEEGSATQPGLAVDLKKSAAKWTEEG